MISSYDNRSQLNSVWRRWIVVFPLLSSRPNKLQWYFLLSREFCFCFIGKGTRIDCRSSERGWQSGRFRERQNVSCPPTCNFVCFLLTSLLRDAWLRYLPATETITVRAQSHYHIDRLRMCLYVSIYKAHVYNRALIHYGIQHEATSANRRTIPLAVHNYIMGEHYTHTGTRTHTNTNENITETVRCVARGEVAGLVLLGCLFIGFRLVRFMLVVNSRFAAAVRFYDVSTVTHFSLFAWKIIIA